MVSEIKDTEKKEDKPEDKKEDKPEDKGEGGGKGEGEGKDKGKKGSKNTGIKPDKEDIKRAKKKLRDAEDMNDIFKTYRYKKDWKYLEKHLQQWQGEPYDFIDNYYKSPDWAYYKPASKHNELVDAINGRKYPLKSDSYVERTVGLAKEILGVFVKMFVVVYVGCFLMWNSFHSVQSKDLDLDDENHQFNVDKFMNMIEIYQDQSPDVYIFVKSIYVGLAKIPRDALYYVFCQINKIMDPLYYGGGGGALWDAKKAYGRTPSQIRSVIQLLIVGVLPFVMYYVGMLFAAIFMFGHLHLGYVKSTINLINTGFFENKDYWFFKYNFMTIFVWLTVGALAHLFLIPGTIGVFFVVGYLVKMFKNVGKATNIFKNITKSFLNIAIILLIFGILLVKKYNLYFHEKLSINIKTKGLIIVAIAAPFIVVPLYHIYGAFFGPKKSNPSAVAAATVTAAATAATAATATAAATAK
tara:strand:+ start:1236 stop:2639 length:1404 start_codon:yes stop_codon:yes gene_type:complete